MSKKRKTKVKSKITIKDYIKAVKKISREEELAQSAGWKRTTNIHKSKKVYDRKQEKRNISEE